MQTRQSEKPFEIQVVTLESWELRPLKNNFFELVLIKEGTGTQCINYNHYEYKKGNIFMLPPLRCHSFTIEEPTEFVFLKFTKSFFKQEQKGQSDYENWFKQASYILANYAQRPGDLISNIKDHGNVTRIIDMIITEAKNQETGSSELIKTLMVSILQILLRSIKSNPSQLNNDIIHNRLNEMTTYIQEHLHVPNKIKIDVLAGKFLVSPTYLSEFFKKHMGISLSQYITKSRLKLAEIRLLYSDYTLNQISYELGFTDASHLSRTFKKYTGTTIREFKKNGDYCLLKNA